MAKRKKTETPEPEPVVDETPEPAPVVDETPESEPSVPRVAAGKAITSKRGVLKPGTEVKPEYFSNGEETLKELIEKGFVE